VERRGLARCQLSRDGADGSGTGKKQGRNQREGLEKEEIKGGDNSAELIQALRTPTSGWTNPETGNNKKEQGKRDSSEGTDACGSSESPANGKHIGKQ